MNLRSLFYTSKVLQQTWQVFIILFIEWSIIAIPKYVFSSLYKSHILAIQFSNNHLIINLLSYYDSSVFDQFSWNLAQMCALVCRCARHIFDSGRKSVAMVTAYYGKNGGKILRRDYFSVFHQSSWNLAQMFALGCRCARHIFLTVAESVAMVMAYYGKNGGENLTSRTTSSVFHQFSWNLDTDVLPWSVDVQDTFFFDSGRKCVAMVTAYYGKNGGNLAPRTTSSVFTILMKFGTDVCLGVYI